MSAARREKRLLKGIVRVAEESMREPPLRKDSGRTDLSLMSKQNVLTRAKKKHAYACVQSHRLGEARGLYEGICARDPRDAESWFMLGTVCGRMGDIAAAEHALRKALAITPDFAQARLNLGHALELQGRYAEAEDCYHRAAALKSDLADAHESLGRMFEQRGEWGGAREQYEFARRLHPAEPTPYLALGRLAQRSGGFAEAIHWFEQALRIDAHHAEGYYLLAGAQLDAGQFDAALLSVRQAQALKPDFLKAVALEASVLLRRGDAAAARARPAPAPPPPRAAPELALAYAEAARDGGDVEEAARLLETLLGEVPLSDRLRQLAYFRLGELYDALHEYDRAFVQFQHGNRLKRARFDREAWARHIDALIAMYSADAIARAPRAANCSERPLFVVGMPRSGTTLVAQILGSHPVMVNAGDLQDITALASECEARLAVLPGGDGLTRLDRAQCDAFAQRYLDTLARIAPDARRVIDKMPQNFLHLGLITLLFPVARVIQCVRDPHNTCLSCYFQDFGGDLPYAYDLADLGFYHREYRRLMAHWREAIQTPILEVRYEDLVNSTEKVAGEMVKFCGLQWDARCLDFHRGAGAGAAAGGGRGREPGERQAGGRWRHYDAHLEPLLQSQISSIGRRYVRPPVRRAE